MAKQKSGKSQKPCNAGNRSPDGFCWQSGRVCQALEGNCPIAEAYAAESASLLPTSPTKIYRAGQNLSYHAVNPA